MNVTLPPVRDLPAGRHAEIRAAVVRAVEGPARTRWLAPALAAAAALVAVGLVWVVPTGGGSGHTAGSPVTSATQDDAVARGCAEAAQLTGDFELRQMINDAAGRFAVVYSDEYVLSCDVDSKVMPYNSSLSGLPPFTPPITLDSAGAMAGGDVPGGKPEYAGTHGWEYVIGRVAPEVARVTYTQGADTVEASVADGTFVARIVRPTDWAISDERPGPVVRAYDANGTLLAESP